MRYSVQPRDLIFVKGYRFLSFAKNIGKNIGKNISKNLSGKYSQKLVNHAKKSAADALKTSSKRIIQKTAEATSGLIGDKTADIIMKVSKTLNIITQRQLQMRVIRKYLKKDKYLQKKDGKLLLN